MHSLGEDPDALAATGSGTARAADDPIISPDRLRLFAVLLGMPEKGSLKLLDELSVDRDWLRTACDELRQIPLEHWQAEHTRLFVTGFPHTVCPPFKSAYSGQGTAPGSAPEDLAGFYHRHGLSAQEMPPDYLGTMLECWAYLAEQPNDDAVQSLHSKHLAPWLTRFAVDLQQSSALQLYRALGEQLSLVDAFLTERSRD